MPSSTKRRRVESPSFESSDDQGKLFDFPHEILALIVSYACQGPTPSSLSDLALVSKAFAAVTTSVREESLGLKGFSQVARVAKYKKTKEGKRFGATRKLFLELETIYPPSMSTALGSLRSLFASISSTLISLSLFVPSTAHNPLPHLFGGDSLSALTQLSRLTKFHLRGGEIWFDDVLTLVEAWPSLVMLELVSNVRGDCNSRRRRRLCTNRDHDDDDDCRRRVVHVPKRLVKVVMARSTLTDAMIGDFLDGQTGLVSLEMPLPGGGGCGGSGGTGTGTKRGGGVDEGFKAWAAIGRLVEPVAGKLRVLKVWDRWGEQTAAEKRKEARKKKKKDQEAHTVRGARAVNAAKGRAKGKARATERDSDAEGQDEVEQFDNGSQGQDEEPEEEEEQAEQFTSSPLLELLSKPGASSIRSLLVTTAYLPSSPSPESWLELVPHLNKIVHLTIEDTVGSCLREMVEKALRKGTLPNLRELTSVGVKKRKAPRNKATPSKEFVAQQAESATDEDELEYDDEDERRANAAAEPVASKFAMTKTELKFYDFCQSKRVEWKIEHAVWKV